MATNENGFRTSMFGGFKKKDVFEYFNQATAENQQEIEDLESALIDAKTIIDNKDSRISELEQELADAKSCVSEPIVQTDDESLELLKQKSEQLEEISAKITAIQNENNRLQQELAAAKLQNAEKAEIADSVDTDGIKQRMLESKIEKAEQEITRLNDTVSMLEEKNIEYSVYKEYYETEKGKNEKIKSAIGKFSDDDFDFIYDKTQILRQIAELSDMVGNIKTKINAVKNEFKED